MQRVHIEALSTSLNQQNFCVRGRITSAIRTSDGALELIRLQSIEGRGQGAKSLTPPRLIDVKLGGRWRSACSALRNGFLVQVDCPVVCQSSDFSVNMVALQLIELQNDEVVPVGISKTALHILDGNFSVISSLTSASMANGTRLASIAPSAAPNRKYDSIMDFWKDGDKSSGPDQKNVFGVILDCRAPYETRGPDLRFEVVIVDETSLNESNQDLKTLKLYCFEKNPQHCIPFRAVGDIIRAHRVHPQKHVNKETGECTRMGFGRFYSTYVLWSGDGQDFEPLARRDAISTRRTRGGPAIREVTEFDRMRVASLRKWSQTVLLKRCRIHRHFVLTVSQILDARSRGQGVGSVDMLCAVEQIHESPGEVEFYVSDGFCNPGQQKQLLRVTSHNVRNVRYPKFTFADFCPSWGIRPCRSKFWVLIRDVCYASIDKKVCILRIGQQTSTIIWYPFELARRQLHSTESPSLSMRGGQTRNMRGFWLSNGEAQSSHHAENRAENRPSSRAAPSPFPASTVEPMALQRPHHAENRVENRPSSRAASSPFPASTVEPMALQHPHHAENRVENRPSSRAASSPFPASTVEPMALQRPHHTENRVENRPSSRATPSPFPASTVEPMALQRPHHTENRVENRPSSRATPSPFPASTVEPMALQRRENFVSNISTSSATTAAVLRTSIGGGGDRNPRLLIQGSGNDSVKRGSVAESVHEYERILSLRDLKLRVRNGTCQKTVKVWCKVKACSYPENLRFASRPMCGRCGKHISSFTSEIMDIRCKMCPILEKQPLIKWEWFVRLWLRDENSEGMHMWVMGDTANEFFSAVRPCNFFAEAEEYKKFLACLQMKFTEEFHDQYILPFEFEDEYDIYRVAAKLCPVVTGKNI